MMGFFDPGRWALVFVVAAAMRWALSMWHAQMGATGLWAGPGALGLAAVLILPTRTSLPGLAAGTLATAGTALVLVGTWSALLVGAAEHGLGNRARRADAETLLLLAAAGMTALMGASDLWTAFVAFELMSVPFYAMAGFGRDAAGIEAGVRLLLPGAAATVLFALGAAAGPQAVGTAPALPIEGLGYAAVLAAVLFKAALLPFGFWVGDVYRGAPIGVVAALATAPKWAALVFAAQWLQPLLNQPGARGAVAAIAQVAMLVGTGIALQRRTLRGILAWSGVAHVGFVLILLMGPADTWAGGLVVYGVGYLLAVIAALAAIAAFEARDGACDLDSIRGEVRSGDPLPAALIVALFSLAGIPFLLGFWGKFAAMLAAARAAAWGTLAAALAATVVGLYVYLRVAGRIAWPVDAPSPVAAPSITWRRMRAIAVIAAVGLILLGLAPAWIAAPWSPAGFP